MKNIKSQITFEIRKRMNEKKENENVVGTEIRTARISNERTLVDVSSDICSPSYLYKIESNQIVPNKVFVSELFEKLGVDSKKIDAIYDSIDVVEDCIRGFFLNDYDLVKSYNNKLEGLKNYRVCLLNFIQSIYQKNFSKAFDEHKKLTKALKSMRDYDLMVFGVFSGIFHYYSGYYDAAKEDLLSVSYFKPEGYLALLIDLYLFYLDLILSKIDAVISYEKFYNKALKVGAYNRIEEASYYLGIMLAKYQAKRGFDDILKRINKKKYLNSLKFLYTFYGGNFQASTDEKDVSDFVKALSNTKKNKKYVLQSLDEHQGLVELDYDYYFLEYLMQEDDAKVDYISETITPVIEVNRDLFLVLFFTKELAKSSLASGKYKQVTAFFQNVFLKPKNNKINSLF